MLWPWYVVIGVGVLELALVWLAIASDDLYAIAPFMLAAVGLIACVVFFAIAMSLSIGRHNDRVSCRSYAKQTGRPTRFVIRQTFDTDCLTRATDGRWISIRQLREFPEQNP